MNAPHDDRMSPEEIAALVQRIGGVANMLAKATREERGQIYHDLGIRLKDDHRQNVLEVQALTTVWMSGVRKGT